MQLSLVLLSSLSVVAAAKPPICCKLSVAEHNNNQGKATAAFDYVCKWKCGTKAASSVINVKPDDQHYVYSGICLNADGTSGDYTTREGLKVHWDCKEDQGATGNACA